MRQRIRDVELRPVLEDVGVKVVDVSILVTEKIFFFKKTFKYFFLLQGRSIIGYEIKRVKVSLTAHPPWPKYERQLG